ncbi:MAG TPA: hypothetical protein VN039_06360, partial [Nitrospira sp.]|nr:hypothetical protein [Nitrospira sp.]
MSDYQNEAGEWLMDGAAMRFEQQLDMEAQADYYADTFYEDAYDEQPDDGYDDEPEFYQESEDFWLDG